METNPHVDNQVAPREGIREASPGENGPSWCFFLVYNLI